MMDVKREQTVSVENETEDYCCTLYTTAGTEYEAIKKSFHVDFGALLEETEAKLKQDVEETDGWKLEVVKKTVKRKGRKKGTDFEASNDGKEKPEETTCVTSEDLIDLTTERPIRQCRHSKRGAQVPDPQPKQKSVTKSSVVTEPSVMSTVIDNISISSESDTEVNNISLPDEDDNYEMSIKVWWKFERFDKFTIRRYQKMTQLFEHYSELEKVSQGQVLLMLNDCQIHPNDTPDSLKMTIASVIEGGVTTRECEKTVSKKLKSAVNVDEIELKIQQKGHRDPILICINKTQKMRVLILKCAEHLELPEEKLKFSFDGETLNPHDTPIDLDLEGGECIDLRISA